MKSLEEKRKRCRDYYWRNVEKQRARTLANYHKWKKDPQIAKKFKETNHKAQSKRRFGVENRQEILIRFQYRCTNCGKVSKNLVVHHIDNLGRKVMGKIKPNNSPENLITLCRSCHVGHHTRGLKLQMKI